MAELPTTSYAILGLLKWGPQSRYELWQKAEISIANFWTIAKSQMYSELTRLEKLGYVKGKDVRQKGKPDKRVYQLSATGSRALDAWLSTADIEQDRIRSSFLVKLFFAGQMEPATVQQLIDGYGDEARKGAERLEIVVANLERMGPDGDFMRLCALLGLKMHEAMIQWAEEATKVVAKRKKGANR